MNSKILFSVSALSLLMVSQVYAAPQDEGSWGNYFDWSYSGSAVMTPQGNILSSDTAAGGRDLVTWNPELGTSPSSRSNANIGLSGAIATVLIPGTNKVFVSTGNEAGALFLFDTQDNSLFQMTDNSQVGSENAANQPGSPIILPSGEIMLYPHTTNPEIYSPSTNQWRSLDLSSDYLGFSVSVYGQTFSGNGDGTNADRSWLAPSGEVLRFWNITAIFPAQANVITIDPTGNDSSTRFVSSLPTASQVMYQPGKLFTSRGGAQKSLVTNINGAIPFTREISVPRSGDYSMLGTTVMLPDGKVVSVGKRIEDGGISRLEIWDPATEAWSLMSLPPTQSNTDFVYSIMLLKDGRLLARVDDGQDNSFEAGIFSPPYLYSDSGALAQRPEIVSAPSNGTYGASIIATHASGDTISRVTLIKSGRLEGSYSIGQRFIELDFTDTANGINVTLPASANVAPPGHYIMYLLDNDGVPSEGHIINISESSGSTGAFPTASPDFATVTGSNTITIDALANDTGTALTLNPPNAYSQKGGNVALVGGKITYKPKAGFNGTDKIWYTFVDALGRSNSGEITITVSGNGSVITPYPTATADNVTATTGVAKTIDVLANDTGTGLILNAPNIWSLAGGRVALVSNKLVYTSKTGFTGSDKIWYTFKDSQGRTNSGQVNITVQAIASGNFPIAKADFYITTKNTGKLLDILANDTTSGGKAIDTLYSYTAKGGWTSKASNGRVWYKPKAGFTGEDNFWYVMIDSQGRKNSAQVKITVK